MMPSAGVWEWHDGTFEEYRARTIDRCRQVLGVTQEEAETRFQDNWDSDIGLCSRFWQEEVTP